MWIITNHEAVKKSLSCMHRADNPIYYGSLRSPLINGRFDLPWLTNFIIRPLHSFIHFINKRIILFNDASDEEKGSQQGKGQGTINQVFPKFSLLSSQGIFRIPCLLLSHDSSCIRNACAPALLPVVYVCRIRAQFNTIAHCRSIACFPPRRRVAQPCHRKTASS